MSSAEPFMPAHWPSDRERAHTEIDLDADVDVLPPSVEGVDDDAARSLDDVDLPENEAFRTPVPGDALTGDELAADLGAAADSADGNHEDAEG